MPLTRRQLLRSGFGLASSGLMVPAGLWSPRAHAGATSERYILFVLANGGWDPTYVFAPKQDAPNIDGDEGGETAEAGGVTFVDSDERPAVRDFFERYGDRSCVINGIEVRSISHERCRRILMTGTTATDTDDWGAILASTHSDTMLPYLVTRGPSYSNRYTDLVIRLGESGQFDDLLTGAALTNSDMATTLPSDSVTQLTDAFLQQRLAAFTETAPSPRHADVAAGYVGSLDRLKDVSAIKDTLQLTTTAVNGNYVTLFDQISPLLSVFSQGLGRAAIAQHDGLWDDGWDTHANNNKQSTHYQDLFENLVQVLDAAATLTTPSGASLVDVMTVVVLSEMGRAPGLNSVEGKDHWTYTSAMLVGAGVQGGQVVGAYDDSLLGEPVDLASGEAYASGEHLTAAHLGSTILALGNIDPDDFMKGISPIAAALR